MKNVKIIEPKANKNYLKNVKEGKIKKNNQSKDKKLGDLVAKIEQEDLAPKIENTNLKPSNNDGAYKTKKKNKGNKSKFTNKQEKKQVNTAAPQKVANDEVKTKNDNKSKKNKVEQEKSAQAETPTKELTETELKKIEKKKAKKLAQKLKKQQKKLERKDNKYETPSHITNGVNKENTTQKPANKTVDSTSSKVLTKKEKKAQKRQMIKEQKLADKQSRDPAVEAATVFVGNVPVNTKRVQLVRLFKDFGPVNSIRLRSAGGQVLYKHKQRRAACALNAYVVLKNKEAAEKALSLNGVEFKGHHLRITLATKSPQGHEKEEAKRTVFVGNLKYTATEESLREIFSSCGEVDYVRCLRDGDKGCKGVAYVCFKKPDAVGLALELNETIVDERPINVERFSVKKLGAKEAREAQAAKEIKSKKSVKLRLNSIKSKKEKSAPKKESQGDDDKKPKKSEFRGIKVEGLKKKQKSKKKKKLSNDQMLKLAKKIAPKPKTE